MHLDGCHFFTSSYVCECGATASTYTERDVKSDPYSVVWMDGEGQDEPCARCEQLLDGRGDKPKHDVTIQEVKA